MAWVLWALLAMNSNRSPSAVACVLSASVHDLSMVMGTLNFRPSNVCTMFVDMHINDAFGVYVPCQVYKRSDGYPEGTGQLRVKLMVMYTQIIRIS